MDAQNLERNRTVEPHVHGLIDRAHSSPAELAHDPVAGDPPARLDPVVEPSAAAASRAGRRPEPEQAVNQLEALNRRTNVVFQPRKSSDEVVEGRRLALLAREQVHLDRFANAIIVIAPVGGDVKIVRRVVSGFRHR